MNPQDEAEIHLRDYYYILVKRKKMVLACLAASLLLGIFLTFTAKVLYEATATLLIEKQNPNVVDFKEVMAFDSSSTDYYQTQYQILRSESLVRELIEREHLDQDHYLRGLKEGGLRARLRKTALIGNRLAPFIAERKAEDLFISRMLKIKPIRNSQLVSVVVRHPDKKRAAEIVNTLAELYIERNLRSRYDTSTQATKLIAEQLVTLKDKVALADRRLQKYKESKGLVNITSIREQDAFLQDAKLSLLKLQAKEARLAKRYLEAHPKRIHLRSQIEGLEEKMAVEDKRKLEEGSMAIKYSELEREAESAKKIYEALLERLEETQSEAKSQASNILIVDKAVPEPRPSSPKPFLNLLMAFILGLAGGLMAAFLAEYLDSTVKVPDDIEKGLGLDLYGIIPKAERIRENPLEGEIFLNRAGAASPASESIRALRTALLFKLRHISGARVLIITSPNPEEGKSTIALNLAAAFQQNHLRVLLVDADLRRPRLHKAFGLSVDEGLTNILEGQADFSTAVKKNVAGLGIDFLAAGTILDHPTEILGTEQTKSFFRGVRSAYDIILLDTSPYLAVADVAVLSEYADLALVIACYHKTDKRHLAEVKRFFSESQLNLVGLVMNQVNPREKNYYYHRYYYYGYGEPLPKR
ncbi:MAG: polysaccharide biosynthesis tyrosine autokinase [Candidatus Omnitrophica bacterium]|nr:polysaccharide biosynthesis tyrosine autokinase [Candidatus Omnitrophota bacterium]